MLIRCCRAAGLTNVTLDERCKDCSLRSLIFDSLASELGVDGQQPMSRMSDHIPTRIRYVVAAVGTIALGLWV
jgi:hypothetical protein